MLPRRQPSIWNHLLPCQEELLKIVLVMVLYSLKVQPLISQAATVVRTKPMLRVPGIFNFINFTNTSSSFIGLFTVANETAGTFINLRGTGGSISAINLYSNGLDFKFLSDVTVGTLTLLEGVNLLVADGVGISVNQALQLSGSSSSKVTIKGVTTGPGSWKGIHVDPTSGSSAAILTYASIEDAGSASWTTNGGDISGGLGDRRHELSNCFTNDKFYYFE